MDPTDGRELHTLNYCVTVPEGWQFEEEKLNRYDFVLNAWRETGDIPIGLRRDHLKEILDAVDGSQPEFCAALKAAIADPPGDPSEPSTHTS